MARRPSAPFHRLMIRDVREAEHPLLPVPVIEEHFSTEQLLRAANAGAIFYDAGDTLMGDYSAISLLTEMRAREGEAA